MGRESGLLREGEGESHGGALVGSLARGGDRTAVPLHNLAADRQADAGPLEFVATVQSLENFKNTIQVLFFKANAVIGDCQFNARRLTSKINAPVEGASQRWPTR